jgi:hypothetical protein
MKTKFAKLSTSLMFAAVILMAATSFAEDKATLNISHPVTVNGNALPAGEYKVVWEGTGPTVELKFMKGKKVAATASAQVVNLKTANVADSIVTKNENDHLTLTQFNPDRKKFALAIGGEATASADSGAK